MIGADNRRQMKLQVIGKKTGHRRALLPDTIGKNSLFVKTIMEHYGQGEGYRFDAASMVYLLPAALPDTEEEKKEPEEEKALAYILREWETVKQTVQIERNREFVVRIMEKTVLPAGVEMLHRASERKQTEKLLQRLLKDYQYIRLTEMREFLRETEKKIRLAAPGSEARGASSDGKYLRAEKAVQQKAAKLIAGLAALPAEKKVRERRAVSRELVRLFLPGEEGNETFLPARDEESGPKLQELPLVLREVSAEMGGLLQRMERQDTEDSGLLPDDADRMLERGTETLQKAETILTLLETERLLKESGKVPESREHLPKEARIQPEVLQLEANVERLLVYHERRIGRELEEQAFFHEIRQMLDFHEWETSKTSGPALMLQRLDRLQKRRKSAETAEAALYRELETLLVRYEQEPGRETEETKITAGGTELHTFLREMRSLLERQESVESTASERSTLYRDLETLLVRYEQGQDKERNEIKETVREIEMSTVLQEVRRLLERQESVESTASERSTLYRDLETLLVRYEQRQDKERNEIKETVRKIEMSTVLQEVRSLLERQESVESTVSERSSLYRELETLLVRYEQEPGRETEETKITAGGTESRTFLREMRSLLERQESVESKETERGTLYHDLETLLVRYEQGQAKETKATKETVREIEMRTILQEVRSLLERQESVESTASERSSLYRELETFLVRYEQKPGRETEETKLTVGVTELHTFLRELRSLLEGQESVESTVSERGTLYHDLETLLVRYEQEQAKETKATKETVREIETRTVLQEVRSLLEQQESVESMETERSTLYHDLETLLVRYEQGRTRETNKIKETVRETETCTILQEVRSLLERQESVESTTSERSTLYRDLETLLVRYEQESGRETEETKITVSKAEPHIFLREMRSLLERQESVENKESERSTLYHDLETLLVRYEQGRAKETNEIKETVREIETHTILQEVRNLLERQESVESTAFERSTLYRDLETLLVRHEQESEREMEETKITVGGTETRTFLREVRSLLERQEFAESTVSGHSTLYHDLERLLIPREPAPGNPLQEGATELTPPDLRSLSETAMLVQEHRTKPEPEASPGPGEEKAVSAEAYGEQERQLRELRAQTSRQEKKLKQMEEWKQDVLRKMEEEKEPPAEQKRAVYRQFQERLRLERMRRGFS